MNINLNPFYNCDILKENYGLTKKTILFFSLRESIMKSAYGHCAVQFMFLFELLELNGWDGIVREYWLYLCEGFSQRFVSLQTEADIIYLAAFLDGIHIRVCWPCFISLVTYHKLRITSERSSRYCGDNIDNEISVKNYQKYPRLHVTFL